MKINPSRKYTESIMNHQGYGELVINKAGNRITIPTKCISSEGAIRKPVQACIKDLSIKNIERLLSYGVIVEKTVDDMVG